jgi:hypothetical protein
MGFPDLSAQALLRPIGHRSFRSRWARGRLKAQEFNVWGLLVQGWHYLNVYLYIIVIVLFIVTVYIVNLLAVLFLLVIDIIDMGWTMSNKWGQNPEKKQWTSVHFIPLQ